VYVPVAAIVIIVIRVLAARQKGQPISVSPSLVSVTVNLTIRMFAALFALVVWQEKGSIFLVVGVFLVVFSFLLVPIVIVPIGIPHLSYVLTRLSYFGFGSTIAIYNELLSRLRYGRGLSSAALERFERGLFVGSNGRNGRGYRVAIRAILDAIRGERDSARHLFQLVAELRSRQAPRRVRAYCQAWLLADAFERRKLNEVVHVSTRGPFTLRARFFRAAAYRLLEAPNAPSDTVLTMGWLLCGNPGKTWELYQAAKVRKCRKRILLGELRLDTVRLRTFEALRLNPGVVTRSEICELASAWQVVFDNRQHEEFLSTRLDVGAVDIDVVQIAANFENEVISVLVELWRRSLPLETHFDEEPPLLVAVKDEIQFELVGQFERIANGLARDPSDPDGDYESHWRNWARLRTIARDFLMYLPERHVQLSDAGCTHVLNHGAWLYNHERARVLAHDIFRWLVTYFPKDSPNYEVVSRNVRLSRNA
jgi:hypothetical protein